MRIINGTITFETRTAQAIWDNEITGQLSDGMWENTRPDGHWRFWSELKSAVGTKNEVEVTGSGRCRKNGYKLTELIDIVGYRMKMTGRMAKAGGTGTALDAANYMPETYEQWLINKETGKWQYEFVNKYMDALDICTAADYYSTEYTEKELRADLKRIKQAMKTAKVGY